MATSTSGLITKYSSILRRFPQSATMVFAYGSGVKKQLQMSPNSQSAMIDVVFCVDDPTDWHDRNLKLNPSHYSFLKFLGHETVAKVQTNLGAKIYFNTLVPLDDYLIKYGVVATEDLITDLLEWSELYMAGRLHKPVDMLQKTENPDLQTALKLNLQSAVHTALLMLPEIFTEYEFYYTISNISYAGDFRMTFGENKNKVENIVKPQIDSFRKLYTPFIGVLNDYVNFPIFANEKSEMNDDQEKYCTQDVSYLAKLHHLNQLPRWPQKALTRLWNKGSYRQDTEDVLRAIACDPDSELIVKKCINDIVWSSSVKQSLKGILTAGFTKSIRYSGRKIMKMLHM